MILRPPSSTPTYTLFPYTPLVRAPQRAAQPLAGRRRGRGRRGGEERRRPVRRAGEGQALPEAGAADDPGGRGVRCARHDAAQDRRHLRSEEHTSELQSLMRISYAVFCLKQKKKKNKHKRKDQ